MRHAVTIPLEPFTDVYIHLWARRTNLIEAVGHLLVEDRRRADLLGGGAARFRIDTVSASLLALNLPRSRKSYKYIEIMLYVPSLPPSLPLFLSLPLYQCEHRILHPHHACICDSVATLVSSFGEKMSQKSNLICDSGVYRLCLPSSISSIARTQTPPIRVQDAKPTTWCRFTHTQLLKGACGTHFSFDWPWLNVT